MAELRLFRKKGKTRNTILDLMGGQVIFGEKCCHPKLQFSGGESPSSTKVYQLQVRSPYIPPEGRNPCPERHTPHSGEKGHDQSQSSP